MMKIYYNFKKNKNLYPGGAFVQTKADTGIKKALTGTGRARAGEPETEAL